MTKIAIGNVCKINYITANLLQFLEHIIIKTDLQKKKKIIKQIPFESAAEKMSHRNYLGCEVATD